MYAPGIQRSIRKKLGLSEFSLQGLSSVRPPKYPALLAPSFSVLSLAGLPCPASPVYGGGSLLLSGALPHLTSRPAGGSTSWDAFLHQLLFCRPLGLRAWISCMYLANGIFERPHHHSTARAPSFEPKVPIPHLQCHLDLPRNSPTFLSG